MTGVRQFCLKLPHCTEAVQWENHLVFKIGGKTFVVTYLEPSEIWLSVKCTPELFSELIERPGIIPAPYMARAHWVALQNESALRRSEVEELLRSAYDLVLSKLPKKTRLQLSK